MFTQNYVLHKFLCELSTGAEQGISLIPDSEITNFCALHNFDQNVRKEGHKLIAYSSKTPLLDKLSQPTVEDAH